MPDLNSMNVPLLLTKRQDDIPLHGDIQISEIAQAEVDELVESLIGVHVGEKL